MLEERDVFNPAIQSASLSAGLRLGWFGPEKTHRGASLDVVYLVLGLRKMLNPERDFVACVARLNGLFAWQPEKEDGAEDVEFRPFVEAVGFRQTIQTLLVWNERFGLFTDGQQLRDALATYIEEEVYHTF